jgi:hypothetical protein
MPLFRWFRRLRPRPAAPTEAQIDPLPWADRVSQVRTMMDAFDAARPPATDRSEAPTADQPAPDSAPRNNTEA